MSLEDDRLDLRRLLAAVEAAPPVLAVDVLAGELARVLEATEVSLLRDDATALCLDWFGGDSRRDATGGASAGRATVP